MWRNDRWRHRTVYGMIGLCERSHQPPVDTLHRGSYAEMVFSLFLTWSFSTKQLSMAVFMSEAPVTGGSHSQRASFAGLVFSLLLAQRSCLTNNNVAGDLDTTVLLRRHGKGRAWQRFGKLKPLIPGQRQSICCFIVDQSWLPFYLDNCIHGNPFTVGSYRI